MTDYTNRGLGLIQSELDPRDYIFAATYGAGTLPRATRPTFQASKSTTRGNIKTAAHTPFPPTWKSASKGRKVPEGELSLVLR